MMQHVMKLKRPPHSLMVLVLVLSLNWVLVSHGQNQPVCLKDEFNCLDGTCISDRQLCDGNNDCANGLDELVCIIPPLSGCPPHLRQCGNRRDVCVDLYRICDGINDCPVGEDEANCPRRANSSCLVSQIECPLNTTLLPANRLVPSPQCIPLARVCDCSLDCYSAQDEMGCTEPTIKTPPVSQLMVFAGSIATLLCTAEGYPTPTITWLRNLREIEVNPRYLITSNNGMGVLYINNVTVFDEGEYSCVVTQSLKTTIVLQSTNLTVIDSDPFICKDYKGAEYQEGQQYYNIVKMISGQALFEAADVVFIVDESGSMTDAHEWIRVVVPLLDSSLNDAGIGVGNRSNMYGLVGFGRDADPGRGGIVLTQLTSVEGFLNATHNLLLNGLFEDGYSAIEVALNQVPLRVNASHIFVLVTNEARQPLRGKETLTRDIIEERMKEKGIILNSVVRQGFLYDANDTNSFAFGLNFNGTAFSFDPTSPNNYTTFPNGVRNPDPAFNEGTTYEDYVVLAFNLSGAAWHIDQVRQAQLSKPFSEAFVSAKIDEVKGVVEQCLRCLCIQPREQCQGDQSTSLEDCEGIAPDIKSISVQLVPSKSKVLKGEDLTLTCVIHTVPPNLVTTITWGLDICSSRANCTDNKAFINNFDVMDSRTYFCSVVHDVNTNGFAVATIEMISLPMVNITEAPVNGIIKLGKPLELTCTASGVPTPAIVWKKLDDGASPNPNIIIIEDTTPGMSKLIIDPASTDHSGQYQCIGVNCAGQDNVTIDIKTDCILPDGSSLSQGQQRIFLHTLTLGADVVLIVDESGSMDMEHQWIGNMTKMLDAMLKNLNIGVQDPNLFGVLGFGSSYEGDELSRVLTHNGNRFVNSSDITHLTDQLVIGGRHEDGYAAIQYAFEQYQFRNGAKQFILISDEERDIRHPSINKNTILTLFKNQNTVLNAAISQSFQSGKGIRAFGIDDLNKTYIYDPLSVNLFHVSTQGGPVKDSAYGTTYSDYTHLAFASGGAAWDLNLLRQGGDVATGFTKAFVLVKANEIFRQVSDCLNCSCSDNGLRCSILSLTEDTPECNLTKVDTPDDTIVVTVEPKDPVHIDGISDVTLTCTIKGGQGEIEWTFNGGYLPREAIVVTMATTSTLTFSPVRTFHKGFYTCIVRSSDKKRLGADSTFVQVMGKFLYGLIVDPPTSSVFTSQNLTLKCNITEVGGTLTWEFNYGPLPDNTVISGDNMMTSYLTIIGANDIYNKGRYTCIVKVNTSTLTTSADGIVHVEDEPLKVTVINRRVFASTGTTVRLICLLNCCPGATLTWSRINRLSLPNNAMVFPADNGKRLILEFTNVQVDQCDLYICTAELRGHSTATSAELRVSDPFQVMLSVNSTIQLDYGTDLTIICDTKNNEKVSNWQWTFNGRNVLPPGSRYHVLSETRSVLLICDITLANVGTYTCTANNDRGGTASDETILSVTLSPSMTSSTPLLVISSVPPPVTSLVTPLVTSLIQLPVTSSLLSLNMTSLSLSVTLGPSPMTSSAPPTMSSLVQSSVVSSAPPTMSLIQSSVASSAPPTMSSLVQSSVASSAPPTMSSLVQSSVVSSAPPTMSLIQSSVASSAPPTMSSLVQSSVASSAPPTMSLIQSSVASSAPPTMSSLVQSSVATSAPPTVPLISTSEPTTATPLVQPSISLPMTSSVPLVTTSTPLIATPTPTPILSITLDLGDRIYVDPRTNVNVTCRTNTAATITWQYKDTNTLPTGVESRKINNQASVLIIKEFDPKTQEGLYHCRAVIVMGGDNVDIKDSKSIDIRDGTLSVSVESEDYTFDLGANISIPCNTSVPSTIVWIYSPLGNRLPPNSISNQIDETSAVLLITRFIGSNQGTYQCNANTGTMTDSKQIQINEREILKFAVGPPSIIQAMSDVTSERPIKFTCNVTCKCGGAKVNWTTDNGRPFPAGTIINTGFTGREASLRFSSSKNINGGYTCVITHPTLGRLSRNVSVLILPDPMITVTPEEATVPRESNFTFVCEANRPVRTFIWTRGPSGSLPVSVIVTTISDTVSHLTVISVIDDVNTGVYYCRAMFDIGSTQTDTGNLAQQPYLGVVFTPDSPLIVNQGEQINIECTFECEPMCGGYQSKWDETNLPTGLTARMDFTRRRAFLEATSATSEMSGFYTCNIIRNSMTETSGRYEIKVS